MAPGRAAIIRVRQPVEQVTINYTHTPSGYCRWLVEQIFWMINAFLAGAANFSR
jgi:hypothetical protein